MLVLVIETGYGARYLTGFRVAYPMISALYLKASERRITKFIYLLVTLEIPFLYILLAEYLLAPSDLVNFLFGYLSPSIYSFVIFAMISFTMACTALMANDNRRTIDE